MKNKTIGLMLALNLVLVGLVLALILQNAPGDPQDMNVDETRRVAAAFANRGLYKDAGAMLRKVVDDPGVDAEKKANALFQIGIWHLERALDPEAALAAFVELRERFGDLDIAKEAAKKEVACLDRLGRPLDAKGVLDEAARVDSQKPTIPREGAILAKIGDREITSGDLDAEIRRMPPQTQKEMTDKTSRMQILQSLIARELLYDSALAQGLGKDPEVLRSTAESKKGIMVMRLVEMETADKVHVDAVDIKNYYEANKDKLKDKEGNIPPFESVKAQLTQMLGAEKRMALVQKMIQDLGVSRGLEVFDERL
jgi:tetratricopeptide (TPR) repeat protein